MKIPAKNRREPLFCAHPKKAKTADKQLYELTAMKDPATLVSFRQLNFIKGSGQPPKEVMQYDRSRCQR